MKFCQPHWDSLKAAIIARGLGDMIARDGKEAARQMAGHMKGDKVTLENFDPLMSAHWMILGNAVEMIKRVGGDIVPLMTEEKCPICFLNNLSEEHDKVCVDPNCKKVKGQTFDDWIDKAADGAAEAAKLLKEPAL